MAKKSGADAEFAQWIYHFPSIVKLGYNIFIKYAIIISFYYIFCILLRSCTPLYSYKLQNAKKNARALDLSSSGYVILPASVSGFRHLESINLSNSKSLNLDSVFETMSKMTNLNTLVFNNNEKYSLRKVIIGCTKIPNLKHLSLSGNIITSLPDEIALLPLLESIDLSNNPNINLEDVILKISHLSKMKYINLSNCNLSNISSAVLAIHTLEGVNLSGNHLDAIPDFNLLSNFNSLDISNNQFTEIPVQITKFKNRSKVYIQSNRVGKIHDNIFEVKFGTFNIANNPLLPEEYKKVGKVKARYKWYN